MAATHAISKFERDFQNQIPRESDKKFYIPRFVVIHWINIQIFKICLYKKVMAILSPGIQPIHNSGLGKIISPESISSRKMWKEIFSRESQLKISVDEKRF